MRSLEHLKTNALPGLNLSAAQRPRRHLEDIAWKMANSYRTGHVFGLIMMPQFT